MMKKYFITGLVILLPLAVTIAIIHFLFNLLTTPFLGLVKNFFKHFTVIENGFLIFSALEIQTFIAQLLILASLFFMTIGLGFIARWFFFTTLMKFTDYVVTKIPVVNTIYKVCQDVIKTIFTNKTNSFKQVVLVRFPNPSTYSIGLITSENIPPLEGTPYANPIAVFVPTTPNPTSGFLIFYNKDEVIYLDMKIEDAFKYVVSCGVIISPFHKQTSVIESVQASSNESLMV